MTMTMSNEQLTVAFQALEGTVGNLTTQLQSLVPQVASTAQEASKLAQSLDEKLKKALNPIVEADLLSVVKKADELLINLNTKAIEAEHKIKNIEANMAKMNENTGAIDSMRQFVASVSTRVDGFSKDLTDAKQTVKDEEKKADTRYAQQQQQLATMMSTMTSSTSSSGTQAPRTSEPIVVHKLIINKPQLSGSETFEQIDEWYMDMANDVEMIIPGAKAILKEAENPKSQSLSPRFSLMRTVDWPPDCRGKCSASCRRRQHPPPEAKSKCWMRTMDSKHGD